MIDDLDSEQRSLFLTLVEADRKLPRAEREQFAFYEAGGNSHGIQHPGLPDSELSALRSDLLALADEGLLRIEHSGVGAYFFDITPMGYRVHAEMTQGIAEPVRHLEEQPRRHMDAASFQRLYPRAYAKWTSANGMLWADDANENLTLIGHECTEAIQAFASELVALHNPPNVEPNPALHVKRLDAVIDLYKPNVGEAKSELLHASVNYWAKVSAVAERQEHGSAKAGDPVTWEDASRVVLHTAIVMFEIDRTLPK